MKICLVSSEVAPFAKTGGLADVCAALARQLGARGHDVRIFMPMYRRVRASGLRSAPHPDLQDLAVELGARRFTFSVSTAALPNSAVEVAFVRCPELYDRDAIYDQAGDEHLRFALLQRAALASLQHLQWAPDVLHCNDWHSALIPLYLRHFLAWDRLFARTKSVLTIHNIAYQGVFGSDVLGELELAERRNLLYQEDLAEGRVNFLKTGILYADAITTVSETYAREIQSPELGMGLDGLLRGRSENLFGIVNGIDFGEWNPAADPHLPAGYSARDLAGKAVCKRALFARMGLPPAEQALTLACISRLTHQKGFELLPDVLPVLLQREELRLVVLGSGEERYERYFNWLAGAFPTKVAFHNGYDEGLAHLIEAGSDAFLMPSRFEPCGLNQLYSLRYGSVPIVRATGGLADTVEPFDAGRDTGTGFVFHDFTPEALQRVLEVALVTWRDRARWARLQQRGMARDTSWQRRVQEYEALYARLAGT